MALSWQEVTSLQRWSLIGGHSLLLFPCRMSIPAILSQFLFVYFFYMNKKQLDRESWLPWTHVALSIVVRTPNSNPDILHLFIFPSPFNQTLNIHPNLYPNSNLNPKTKLNAQTILWSPVRQWGLAKMSSQWWFWARICP